jgi:hypothetical protein
VAALFSHQPVLNGGSPPVAVRVLAGLTVTIVVVALTLQFVLILQAVSARGLGLAAGVVVFLIFFTTQINALAGLVTLAAAAGRPWLTHNDSFRTAVAIYMLVSGLTFVTILRPYYHHHGLQHLADMLLHYVTPALYAAFWIAAVPKRGLRWHDPLIWLVYPAVYVVLALLFGSATGFFPYPFINLNRLGFWSTSANVVCLGAAIVVIGLVVVAGARRFARR